MHVNMEKCVHLHVNSWQMNTLDAVYQAMKVALKPLKSGEISEQTGIDKKEVDKAIKSLIKENKVSSPKRCYYQAE